MQNQTRDLLESVRRSLPDSKLEIKKIDLDKYELPPDLEEELEQVILDYDG